MSTQSFDRSTISRIAVPPMSRALQVRTVIVRVLEPGEFESAIEQWPAEAIDNRRSLGKGLRWALGIEAGAALGIYCLWLLFR
jgi:hypothetical protein